MTRNRGASPAGATPSTKAPIEKVVKTDAQWRSLLSPEEYRVVRQKGTERAFTGKYWDTHSEGVYCCVACGLPLYSSRAKFDSGTGWPSFWEPVSPDAVATEVDSGFFMTRTELLCARCGGHLGHVFDDGPPPTGQRHCINSASLRLEPAASEGTGGADAPGATKAPRTE